MGPYQKTNKVEIHTDIDLQTTYTFLLKKHISFHSTASRNRKNTFYHL